MTHTGVIGRADRLYEMVTEFLDAPWTAKMGPEQNGRQPLWP